MEIIFDKVKYIINKGTPLEKTILNDVSFRINKCGIYSFLGASNSGKSAIGDLIQALYAPTNGSVKVSTRDANNKISNVKKLRFDVGYVFNNPYEMFINNTVEKELTFALKYFNYKTNKSSMRCVDALKLVGLDEEYLKLDPQILNLVDAKKVALACVLIYNPNIIILDEFTSSLNYEDKKELIRVLRLLKTKYKKTIILLSKDTTFSYEVSDYNYIMSYTKIVGEGDKTILENKELLEQYNLEVPKIVNFIYLCNKKGHYTHYTSNILDLIKEVYRNVF